MMFTPEAVALAPWSFSKTNMAFECSFKFNLKHTQKIKEPKSGDTKELVIGRLLHKAIELMLVHGYETAEPAILRAIESEPATFEEKSDVLCYEEHLNDFNKRLSSFKEEHRVAEENQLVEQRVAFTKDFRPSDFWSPHCFFRGVWDLGLMTKSGYLVILDHKRRGSSDMAKYEKQLKSYAVMAAAMYPSIKGVAPAIHIIANKEISWGTTYSRQQIEDELKPGFIQWVNEAAVKAREDVIVIGDHCKYCAYKDSICKPERVIRRKNKTGIVTLE